MSTSTFYDESYETLRRQILDGTLKPGTRLLQHEIAEEFGLSRVPLREAIRKLEGERLVVVVPRRGVTVPDLSDDDVRDLYLIRLQLEPYAFRRATEVVTDHQLTELADAVEQLATLVDRPADFFHQHDRIVRDTLAISPGDVYSDVVTMVRERSQYLRYAYSQLPGQTQWLLEHRRTVLRAMAQRRGDVVEQLTKLDLIEGRDSLLAWRAQQALPTNGDR